MMARKRIRVWVPKHNKGRLGSLSRRMLFTWFMLSGFIFLFAPERLTNRFQFAFAHVFRWPLSIGRSITLVARTPAQTEVVSRRQYNQLLNHFANVVEQRDQEHEKVERLSGLHVLPAWERMNFVLADIITSGERLQNELIINRGKEDGLAAGQFVLGDNSIIGTISGVSFRMARVKLFTNPTAKVAVKIDGVSAGRLMQGSGGNSAKVRMLKQRVKVGTQVMAGKKPGFLDTPMIIARVTQCERNMGSPLLWDIEVEPVCDIEKLNSVAVIVMNPEKH